MNITGEIRKTGNLLTIIIDSADQFLALPGEPDVFRQPLSEKTFWDAEAGLNIVFQYVGNAADQNSYIEKSDSKI